MTAAWPLEKVVAEIGAIEDLLDDIVLPTVKGGTGWKGEAEKLIVASAVAVDVIDVAVRRLLELRLALDAEYTKQVLEGAPVLVNRHDLTRILAMLVAYCDGPEFAGELGAIVARCNRSAGCNL